MGGVREHSQGSSAPPGLWGSGVLFTGTVFQLKSFSRQMVGVFHRRGFYIYSGNGTLMVFQHIDYFRNNTGQRMKFYMMSD
ncbi:hypothetical protein I79_017647 [Cricetulus griseus]|uniref:Uncharacterized protein n=1 Tax=Cricetulus griseus TaxID=10029 RepID=G3I2K9_CRIGR|nr:hypothetical protein I79_017647 [Cricetulus griseus]